MGRAFRRLIFEDSVNPNQDLPQLNSLSNRLSTSRPQLLYRDGIRADCEYHPPAPIGMQLLSAGSTVTVNLDLNYIVT